MLRFGLASTTLIRMISAITLVLAVGSAYTQESKEIRYPRLDINVDPNEAYINELLLTAIQHAPKSYDLAPTESRMLQGRAIYEMTRPNGKVDLMWSMTTDEREKQLIPIRVPIDKGLIGWRIALLNSSSKKNFSLVRNLDELRTFTAGQEYDWPDVAILRANKLPVLTSNSYEPLFKMLEADRFDYFPRSIFEIWAELENHKDLKMSVDPQVILYYPSACYFFVSPSRPKLAENLRIGLEKMLADGSFEKIFQKYNQSAIDKSDIKHRIIIKLKNPLLNPASLPMNRPELWFTPEN